jgi:tryptophan 2,3-dioxygenase
MPSDAREKAFTYTSYLKVDELLELQQPESSEHDEILFIIIHQVYELWFKQINHEVARIQRCLEGGRLTDALHSLVRVLKILKTLVGQLDILETMTPISFNSFRSRLESASGFQSAQFRELEFRLGHKSLTQLQNHPAGSRGRGVLDGLLDSPSLWDSFLRYLADNGHVVPEELLTRNFRELPPESEHVRQILIDVYRGDDAILRLLCERFVDLDEGLQEWRYRHVKMVERTIGHKRGTGGSAGAAYLRTTLFQPVFPDLWAIRTEL